MTTKREAEAKRTAEAVRRLHEVHAMPRKLAKQKNTAHHLRDPLLCACKSYMNVDHHHCASCGFVIHFTERFCIECTCEQDYLQQRRNKHG